MLRIITLLLLCLNLATAAQTTPTPTPVAEKVLAALVRVFFSSSHQTQQNAAQTSFN